MDVRPPRSDARRNADSIRHAARELFAAEGLDVSLERIAQAAGVSKGTIYNRFGSREQLIDDVVVELVQAKLETIRDDALSRTGTWDRLRAFLLGTWTLQFDDPVANDVLCRSHPHADALSGLCLRSRDTSIALLAACHAADSVNPDVTAEDLYALLLMNGASLKAGASWSRADALRRYGFILDGLSRRP